jgi:uncharacterized membrane protein YeaQ/YmgE (transglycosylase-associated protein family)
MEFVWLLLIGGLAGAISGRVMRGQGFGCLGNIIVGVIGSLLGGFVLPLIGVTTRGGLGSLVSATVGAILLLALLGGRRGKR